MQAASAVEIRPGFTARSAEKGPGAKPGIPQTDERRDDASRLPAAARNESFRCPSQTAHAEYLTDLINEQCQILANFRRASFPLWEIIESQNRAPPRRAARLIWLSIGPGKDLWFPGGDSLLVSSPKTTRTSSKQTVTTLRAKTLIGGGERVPRTQAAGKAPDSKVIHFGSRRIKCIEVCKVCRFVRH